MFTAFLPASIRVRLSALSLNLRALKGVGLSTRPIVSSRHSQQELDALHRAAKSRREALREGSALEAPRAQAIVRELEVVEVIRETAASITIVFANEATPPIEFEAGQFMTLVLMLDGEETRRAYSLCSDPTDQRRVAVTVKRVEGGRVSNHLNDGVKVGDRIKTLGPSGHFGASLIAEASTPIVLIAGGSGVTPLFSIAQGICARQPERAVTLIYGSRDDRSIIFRAQLARLAQVHPQLSVVHVLEEPSGEVEGLTGRLDAEGLAATTPLTPRAEYFICGPEGVLTEALAFLSSAGVEASRVHVERFVAQDRRGQTAGTGAVHTVCFVKSGVMLQVSDGETLLHAGRAAGIDMPFSCAMGGCGACKVHCRSGAFELEAPNCLSEAERASGACLACVARPRSALEIDL